MESPGCYRNGDIKIEISRKLGRKDITIGLNFSLDLKIRKIVDSELIRRNRLGKHGECKQLLNLSVDILKLNNVNV